MAKLTDVYNYIIQKNPSIQDDINKQIESFCDKSNIVGNKYTVFNKKLNELMGISNFADSYEKFDFDMLVMNFRNRLNDLIVNAANSEEVRTTVSPEDASGERYKSKENEHSWSYKQWSALLNYLQDRANKQFDDATEEYNQAKGQDDEAAIQKAEIQIGIKTAYKTAISNLMKEYQSYADRLSANNGNITDKLLDTTLKQSAIAIRNKMFGGKGYPFGGGGGYPYGVGGSKDARSASLLKYPFTTGGRGGDDSRLFIKALAQAFDLFEGDYPNLYKGPVTLNKSEWKGFPERAKADLERSTDKSLDVAAYFHELTAALREIWGKYLQKVGNYPDEIQDAEYTKLINPISAMATKTFPQGAKKETATQQGAATATKQTEKETQPQDYFAANKATIAKALTDKGFYPSPDKYENPKTKEISPAYYMKQAKGYILVVAMHNYKSLKEGVVYKTYPDRAQSPGVGAGLSWEPMGFFYNNEVQSEINK